MDVGRNHHRNITFIPTCHTFGPLEQQACDILTLHEDELEALYLADYKGLYQEACAQELGVSRPTFAKIIKSARRKTVEMLMYAKAMKIDRQPRDFVMAFPTNDRISIHSYFMTSRYFAFAKIENDTVRSIAYTNNPIYEALIKQGVVIVDDDSAKGMAAGRIIPPLLEEANMLVVRSLGDGMRRNIEGMGISIKFVETGDLDAVIEGMKRSGRFT